MDEHISGDRFYRLTTDGIDFVEHPENFPEFGNLIVMLTAGGGISLIGSQVGSTGPFHAQVSSGGGTPDQVAALIEQLRGQERSR